MMNVGNQEHELYILGAPPLPWGDYSDVLIAGMTSHLERIKGLLQLERTGPFVPPIVLAGVGDVVVVDAFKHTLEASGLTGISFRPVIKKRIVRLDWETWDITAAEPQEYPDTGEPEDYILLKPHDQDLAMQIGNLWEIVLGEHARTERVRHELGTGDEMIYLIRSSWDGTDWFRAEGVSVVYISDKAKHWLEETVPGWINFTSASVR